MVRKGAPLVTYRKLYARVAGVANSDVHRRGRRPRHDAQSKAPSALRLGLHPSRRRGGRVLPGSELRVGERRGRQPRRGTCVALDMAELLRLALPCLAKANDLFVGATDEVPPHDDLFAEWFPAEEDHPRGLVGGVGQGQVRTAGAQIAEI